VGTEKRDRQRQGRQARLEQARAAHQRKKRLRTARNFGIFALLVVAALFALSEIGGDDETEVETGTDTSTTVGDRSPEEPEGPAASILAEGATITGETPCPPVDGSAERTTTFEALPPQCIDPTKSYTAVFDTSEGVVRVDLDAAATPITTNNFVVLSRYKYFDGTELFRTDPSIGIIQGGSPHTQDNSDPGPGYDLPDEGFDYAAIGGQGGPYSYGPGDLIMARSGRPDGASAQFFFGVNDAVSGLDAQGVYVNFGETVEGLEVLEAILALHEEDPSSGLGGGPRETVTIETVTIEEG